MNLISNKYLSLLVIAGILSLTVGCSGMPKKSPGEEPPERTYEQYVDPEATYPIDVYDPWEGFNRGMYRFNAGFDRYLFLPVVKGYKMVIPDLAEQGVSNFFDNIFEIRNFINNALQLKLKATGKTVARFTVNSTIGILGLMDPATHFGILEQKEDFGQTLGRYGVGNGPYLVLPILGPSNLRDGIGTAADAWMFSEIDLLDFDDANEDWEIPFQVLRSIDTRSRVGFRYYETGSPYEYELVRMLYSKKREIEIAR